MNFLVPLLVFSAIVSPAFGYSSVYFFHFIALAWVVAFFVSFLMGRRYYLGAAVVPFLLFYAFALVSAVWSADILAFGRNFFYLSCGLLIILAISFYVRDEQKLSYVVGLVVFWGGVQILVGFLESLGVFRLPMSPYSDFYGFFGRDNSYLHELPEAMRLYNESKPTGFFANPNTFGFVILLFAPFFCFHRARGVAVFSFFLFSFVFFVIDSKSLFVFYLFTYIVFCLFWRRSYLVPLALLAPLALLLLGWVGLQSGRVLDFYSELSRGLEIMMSGGYGEDSTGYRAYLYGFGIEAFLDNFLLGVGLGGVESRLQDAAGQHVALHNFYLQLLADLGVVGFSLYVTFYLYLLFFLCRVARLSSDGELRWISQCLFVSLFVAIFSSISPSGILYNLTYWVFVGVSVSVCCLFVRRKRHASERARNFAAA